MAFSQRALKSRSVFWDLRSLSCIYAFMGVYAYSGCGFDTTQSDLKRIDGLTCSSAGFYLYSLYTTDLINAVPFFFGATAYRHADAHYHDPTVEAIA